MRQHIGRSSTWIAASWGVSVRPRLQAVWHAHGAALLAGLLSLGWFLYLGYGATLAPDRPGWLFREDWSTNLWGFWFFRNSPWSFPLGATPDLLWPYGTSVGFTDAIPWLAVGLKPLSPILPQKFQPFGFWFLLCFVLQAGIGAKLTGTLTQDRAQQALGGLLFALTPVVPARNGHIALSALFFVTAGVYLCLRPVESRQHAKSLLGGALLLLIWAAGTHPYLSTMVLALVLARCVCLGPCERVLEPSACLLAAGAAVGVTFATYWTFGYVGWREHLGATGFGQFSADLATLVNPQHWSRWVHVLRNQPRQHEGFGYLGCGVFMLLVLRVALLVREPQAAARSLRRHWPWLLAVVAMSVFALSSSVKLLGREVLDLRPVYAPFSKLTAVFRSSGRFVWPLHVALIAAAVSACAALRSRPAARAFLVAAIVLQAAELDRSALDFHRVPLHPMRDPIWASVGEQYRHLELTPTNLKWVCRYDEALVNRMSYEAYRRHLTFNSGNVARRDPAASEACRRRPKRIDPDDQTVYVVDRSYRRYFHKRAACGTVDGLLICASTRRETQLLAALRRHPA